ncbi:M48 family metallopeptidase [Rhizorhapis sp. SPR117]|uniref:M48 family metallopeptidase n=1 Tax=Rhizorhapis sp. SPR117 TaxID=2912611 RepID=UPI001F167A45|nr:M48 family metallopeptidase [Rhizorhapis sp. SPR117]
MWSKESSDDRLTVGGIEYPLRVRRHARTRSFRLSIDPARLEIRLGLPPKASLRKALKWVSEQRVWLEGQLAAAPDTIILSHGAIIPFEGRDVQINWSSSAPRRVVQEGDSLVVGGPQSSISPRILRWLRQVAREKLTHETGLYAARAGLRLGQVSVGDPRSRWGSCAASGNIRYSWRLICAPIFVRQATVAHEVAHLAHMDHSPAFHARHAQIYGEDPAPARRWLREHGAMLHRIGR